MKEHMIQHSLKKMLSGQKGEIGIHILTAVLLSWLCCMNLSKLNYIAVLNDEFGYWGTAVSMAGYDWKDLIAETPYYSYGYSLLLLPIILLLPTPVLWYKAAILLNVVLLYLSYFICCDIGKRIFGKTDRKLICFVSLVVAMYPGNITYAQVAWSETLQYFLIWCVTWLVVRLEERFSYIKIGRSVILLVYLYCVHNRNIGVIAVWFAAFFIIVIKNKKRVIWAVVPMFGLAAGYFLLKRIKEYEITALWNNSASSALNNINLNGSTLLGYFQILTNNLDLYAWSLYGKLFYLLLATGFTLPVVCILFVKNWWKAKTLGRHFASKFWCIGVLLVMWPLTALQMIDWPARKDIIVYARYIEHVIGPVLFLGIMYTSLYARKIRKEVLLAALVFLIGCQAVYKKIDGAAGFFNSICVPLLGAFYDNTSSLQEGFMWIIFAMEIMLLGIWWSSCDKSNKGRWRVVLIFASVFCVEGYKADTFMNNARNTFETNTLPVCEEILQYKTQEIYYVKDTAVDSYSVNPKYLQYMIPDRTIHVVENMEGLPEGSFLLLLNPKSQEMIRFVEGTSGVKKLVGTGSLNLYDTAGSQ